MGKEMMLDADDLVGKLDPTFDYESIAAQIRMKRFNREYFPVATAAERDRRAQDDFYKGLARIC